MLKQPCLGCRNRFTSARAFPLRCDWCPCHKLHPCLPLSPMTPKWKQLQGLGGWASSAQLDLLTQKVSPRVGFLEFQHGWPNCVTKLEECSTSSPGRNERVDQHLVHRILLWNSHDHWPSTTSQTSSDLKINAVEFGAFLMWGCKWQLTRQVGPTDVFCLAYRVFKIIVINLIWWPKFLNQEISYLNNPDF